MAEQVMLLVDAALPDEIAAGFEDIAAAVADHARAPVRLAFLSPKWMAEAGDVLAKTVGVQFQDVILPRPEPSAAPMSAAPFVWRDDGRPDWGAMWGSFCELALYGGPPHRGEDQALTAPAVPATVDWEAAVIAEIRRGIWETTGLFAEPAEPGWLAVTCHSRKMAAWLCASIILENVEARCEDERLLVPASPTFELKNEVKSVVTVLAKTNHYWQAHIAGQEADALATG